MATFAAVFCDTMETKGEIVGDLNWDGLHRPRIYYAMIATFAGLFLAVIDGTICNVALPSISDDLQVSSSDSIWIINAFQLVIMMTLLPFPRWESSLAISAFICGAWQFSRSVRCSVPLPPPCRCWWWLASSRVSAPP